MSTFNA